MTRVSDGPPRLRADVTLGRALRTGGRTVHYGKDEQSAAFFRIGPKEHFLVSRLDGRRTWAELIDDYAAEFGRRLTNAQLAQLLDQIEQRGLLAPQGSPEPEPEPARPAPRPAAIAPSLWRRAFPLVNPDRWFGLLVERLRGLFHPAFVVPAVAVAATVLLVFLTRTPDLWHDLRHSRGRPVYVPVSIALSWLGLAIHEMAHGVTCKRFGGTAPEVGVIWRFPMLAPYCRVDDVVLFRRRRHAVYTSLAGVFAGLLFVAPFLLVWWTADPGSPASGLAAAVVFFGAVNGLINLVPFLQLDGYFAVTHALGHVDLRQDSKRVLRRWRALLLRRPADEPPSYSTSDRRHYTAYGVLSSVFSLALAATALVLVLRLVLHAV